MQGDSTMRSTTLLVLMLVVFGAKAQSYDYDSVKVDIDVFVSKEIAKGTELSKYPLLNDIDVSSSQVLVLASSNRFFYVGYGNYLSRKVTGKRISSFCVVGDDVYFSDKSNLYRVESDKGETKVMNLPFIPRKLWSGKQDIYAVSRKGGKDDVYVIFSKNWETINFFTSSSSVISIVEYKSLIFILTEKSIVMMNIKEKKYEEFPINLSETGKLLSMSIDKSTGSIYLSSTNGIYRIYEREFQKICNDVGVLCYDIDGMLIFDNKEPFVLRLRNSLLYPAPKGVVIEIK